MNKRDETTTWRQLAEWAAVLLVSKRNQTVDPLEPIKWIRERMIRPAESENIGVFAMEFLFWIDNERRTMTVVKVALSQDDGKWNLLSADLRSDYQSGKDNDENWSFSPDGTPNRTK